MKSFKISTVINAPFETVWLGFDKSLFLALQPTFPRTEVLRFDGSEVGNSVETNIIFFGKKQPFYAEIIERETSENKAYFIDSGTKLPFFLTYWQHKHIVSKTDENTSCITDEIQFAAGNFFMEAFLFPIIYAQLLARKPIYKKHFSAKQYMRLQNNKHVMIFIFLSNVQKK